MKEFIKVYHKNREDIENFMMMTLKNSGSILDHESSDYKKIFQTFPSLELIYITDKEYKQSSANIYRNKQKPSAKGKDRSYLSKKVLQKDNSLSLSCPYISSATGMICITVMKREGEHNIFMDFRLSELLGRLGLVELHPTFNKWTKFFYKSVGFSLMGFAFMSIIYALYYYFYHVFIERSFTLDGLFKPIVALTLGLAIFDLAKTILEREVFFKNYSREDEDANILTKFSIAIIIALSIEALMVVFKIALHDYTQMIYALYLILGVGTIIISLALYTYFSKKAI